MIKPKGDKPDARPLYVQVKELLSARIQSGGWKPGQPIPNEFQLAAEFDVSQGTVRKALDALVAEKAIERRQGRGTFVAQHTPDTVRFRFFKIYDAHGQVQPESSAAKVHVGIRPDAREREALALGPDDHVIHIERVRTAAGKPTILEHIALPEPIFKSLAARDEVPNTLYDFYQTSFGVTVARVEESLRARSAEERVAIRLECLPGTPVLQIERIAFDLAGAPVEYRMSHCLTENVHYQAVLK